MFQRFCFTVLVGLVGVLTACGSNPSAEPAAPVADEVAAAPAAATATPADLGNAVADLYVKAMNDVVELLKDHPEPSAVNAKLKELKEGYIQKQVALGRQREALGAADRQTADTRVSMGLNRVPSATFQQFSDIQRHYMSVDPGMANQIASFNIITQYFNFDLLKKQDAEEAKRLGIQ